MEKQEVLTTSVLTIPDYAKHCDVSRQTVYKWIKAGLVPTKKLGSQQFIDKNHPKPRLR